MNIGLDRRVVPSRGDVRYLAVSLEAPEAPSRNERRAVNLALVLDRSGSMEGKKLERVQEAARHVLRVLRPSDRVSTVAYHDEVKVLTASQPATAEARARAEAALDTLEADGSTNLSGGWLTGCEQVALGLEPAHVGRCLLLTDGLANRGITSPDELVHHASALRERRVTTSTFGVGRDFDEVLLRRLAEAGGGNFYFIEEAGQIPQFVQAEVDETLEITARDVSVQVQAPRGVRVVSLNDFPAHPADGGFRFELGSLVSQQLLELVFELHLPPGDEDIALAVSLRDRDGVMATAPVTLAIQRAGDAACETAPRDQGVLRLAARLRVARASQAALEQNRAGRMTDARQGLLAEAKALELGSPGDDEVRALAEQLRQKAAQFGEHMDAFSRKQFYYESHRSLKGRALSGKAMRKGDSPAPAATPPPGRAMIPTGGLLLLVPTSHAVAPVVERAARGLLSVASTLGGIALSTRLQQGALPEAPGPHALLTKSDERSLVAGAQSLAASVRLVVTERGFEDHWFSHWHAAEGVAIVSLHGWAETAAVAPEAFIAYEALLFGLYARSAQYDHLALLHRETRGCIFDFCQLRAEIEVKLQTADLCTACCAKLAQAHIDPAQLHPFCEVIRSMSRRARAMPSSPASI
ncbi:VWA domain-containing protein [Pendulispora rubella]|uniref:VWA domain-containing protein n=1 Tax=Pendulispora rubella TaxID=2741070 RepID=A0ABZ2L1V6_9BACT